MKKKRRKELRNDMRRILANLDNRWLKAASSELSHHLNQLLEEIAYREIQKILAWTRFFPGEVDLSAFISERLESNEVYLPRSNADRSMTYISIGKNWLDAMETGSMGIPEPRAESGRIFDFSSIYNTVILVPGLAFDPLGNRLGRAKGYYDRFLGKEEMLSAVKIAVVWKFQLVQDLPVEAHDIAVDWICTEEGYFHAQSEEAHMEEA